MNNPSLNKSLEPYNISNERRSQRRRRKIDRFPFLPNHNISLHNTNSNISIDDGEITDISTYNCTFLSNQILDIGDQVKITIEKKGLKIKTIGRIIHCINSKEIKRYGIQFQDEIKNFRSLIPYENLNSRRKKIDLYAQSKRFHERLKIWKSKEFYHYHRRDQVNGHKRHITFNSNDYLCLSQKPQIRQRAMEALKTHGLGTAGPSIFAGDYALHDLLSQEIASLKKMESCLLVPSGFSANSGIFTGLVNIKGTLLFLDEKDHASIFHGALGCRGNIKIFRHNDVTDLERKIKQYDTGAPKVICVDGVYSMDGDIAPLDKIYEISKKYNASLWVDDAHSFGIFGKKGQGIEEHFGLTGKIDIVTGSLSKSLGGIGGFVCAKKAVIDFLDHLGREFVYTTTLPASICAGLLEGLKIMRDESDTTRKKLWENAKYLKEILIEKDFPVYPTDSPIIPIIFGNEKLSQYYAMELKSRGIFVNSVTRPAVKRGHSRLRITVRCDHTSEELDYLLSSLCEIREQVSNHPLLSKI